MYLGVDACLEPLAPCQLAEGDGGLLAVVLLQTRRLEEGKASLMRLRQKQSSTKGGYILEIS